MPDFASSLALAILAAWVLHKVFKLMDRVGQGVRDWGQGRLLEAENEQRRLRNYERRATGAAPHTLPIVPGNRRGCPEDPPSDG